MEGRRLLKVDHGVEGIVKGDYPSNARTPEPQEKKKIIKGSVTIRKKSFGKKFIEALIGSGEGSGSISSYIMNDILIPSGKSMVVDSVRYFFESLQTGFEVILFGDIRTADRIRRDRTGRTRINYNTLFDDRPGDRRNISQRGRSLHRFDEIVFKSRREAEEIRAHLVDLIEEYGLASIADFYDAVGIISTHPDTKYGWDNLSAASIKVVPDGYMIRMPRPILID